MKDYKQQAKDMAKARLEKMGGKRSERVSGIMRADGGRVCKADGGSMHGEPDGDEFDSGAEMDGESSKPRLDKPSRGAGKTTVNIIVGKGQEMPPPAMPMAGPPPPMPPGPPAGPPPGMPPLPMRAAGGRMTAGAESGEGRLEKAAMARKHK